MFLIETDSCGASRVPVEVSFAKASKKDEFNEKRNKPITEVKLNNKLNLN